MEQNDQRDANSSKISYRSERSVSKTSQVVTVQGKTYKTVKLLADANVPYKLTMNRTMNTLFFCINADENSDQSFRSVVLDLHTRRSHIIPSMKNGFASTVDNITNVVYLGGCDGIHKYSYDDNDIQKTPVIPDVDIFDLFFHKDLYYVATASQHLYMFKDGNSTVVPGMKENLVQHFAFDRNDDLYFVNASGVHILPKGAKQSAPAGGLKDLTIRGVSTDVEGQPYFIAQDGIYKLDSKKRIFRVLSLKNGYGLTFDANNNIIFSNERSINRLIPFVKSPTDATSVTSRTVTEKMAY